MDGIDFDRANTLLSVMHQCVGTSHLNSLGAAALAELREMNEVAKEALKPKAEPAPVVDAEPVDDGETEDDEDDERRI